MREADLLDARAASLEARDGLPDPALDIGLHAGNEVLARESEPLAAQPAGGLVVRVGKGEQPVGDRDRSRCRVSLVAPGDCMEQRGGVTDVARKRPDLVERAGERDDPIAADPAVRRLEPDDPGQGRRLADRAARIGPDPEGYVIRGDRDGRTAAAATGDRVEIPRVADGPVGAPFGRRAHREFVHVRLAEDHRAAGVEPFGDVGVVGRPIALEDPGAGGRLAAPDRHQVLESDGDAMERMERAECVIACMSRRAQGGVRRVRLVERARPIDREPCVQSVVLPLG